MAGLHLVEFPDAEAIELLGEILSVLHLHLVLVHDALDEALLAGGAVPGFTLRFGLGALAVVPIGVGAAVSADLICAAVLGLVVVAIGAIRSIAFRDKTGVLDLLVNGVLKELVELLDLCLGLGDVRELDFDGGAEAVAAVLGQAELLAVIGAKFDCHGVEFWWWDVDTKKARP